MNKSNKNISYFVHVTIKLINYPTSIVCGTYIN